MTELFAPVCSIAPTRRRRFFWAAWWTTPPALEPFCKPDASNGGARTREEALREAERAAGRTLVQIEPRWARAWAAILAGEPPPPVRDGPRVKPVTARGQGESVWSILGLGSKATLAEIKSAFRKRALEAHPDHGGDAERFRRLQGAYEEALARRARRR